MKYLFFLTFLLCSSVIHSAKIHHYESKGQCIADNTVDVFLNAFMSDYGSAEFQRRYGAYDVSQLSNPSAKAIAAESQLNIALEFYKQAFDWDVIGGRDRLVLLSNLSDANCFGLNASYGRLSPSLHLIMLYDVHRSSSLSMASDLDVVVHEYGHGVFNEYHPDRNIEVNAINESVADMLGSTARAWLESGKNFNNLVIRQDSFLLGRASFSEGVRLRIVNRSYVRNMANPAEAGHADYYSDVTERQQEEHSFAGVTNLAFYLMAKGGEHPRKNNGIRVEGIGLKKSIKLIFYTLEHQIPFNTLQEFSDAVRKAAKRIHGVESKEFTAVDNAFDAVGLEAVLVFETPQPPLPQDQPSQLPEAQSPTSQPEEEPPSPVEQSDSPAPQEIPVAENKPLLSISGPVFIIILLAFVFVLFLVFIRSFRKGLILKSETVGIIPSTDSSCDSYDNRRARSDNVDGYKKKEPTQIVSSVSVDPSENCSANLVVNGLVFPITLSSSPLMLGRSIEQPLSDALNQIFTSDEYMSRKHCALWYKSITNELYIQSHSDNGFVVQHSVVKGKSKVKVDFDKPVSLTLGKTTILIEPTNKVQDK